MKHPIILFFIALMFSCSLSAQESASRILEKAEAKNISDGGIKVNFTLRTRDLNEKVIHSRDGVAFLFNNKFKVEIPEAIAWFDGQTQWLYIKDTDEVNVTAPTGDELAAISPSALLSLYKYGYELKNLGEKLDRNKSVIEIEMTAKNKSNQLKRVIVEINKADYTYSKFTLYDTNNMENVLIINKYLPKQSLENDFFKFEKKDYPNTEIVDLR